MLITKIRYGYESRGYLFMVHFEDVQCDPPISFLWNDTIMRCHVDLEHALYVTFVRIMNEILARKDQGILILDKKLKWKTKVLYKIEKRKEMVH